MLLGAMKDLRLQSIPYCVRKVKVALLHVVKQYQGSNKNCYV